jgi:hypothetical protein
VSKSQHVRDKGKNYRTSFGSSGWEARARGCMGLCKDECATGVALFSDHQGASDYAAHTRSGPRPRRRACVEQGWEAIRAWRWQRKFGEEHCTLVIFASEERTEGTQWSNTSSVCGRVCRWVRGGMGGAAASRGSHLGEKLRTWGCRECGRVWDCEPRDEREVECGTARVSLSARARKRREFF